MTSLPSNRDRWWVLAGAFLGFAVWANLALALVAEPWPWFMGLANSVFTIGLMVVLGWTLVGAVQVRKGRRRVLNRYRTLASIAAREHALGLPGHWDDPADWGTGAGCSECERVRTGA